MVIIYLYASHEFHCHPFPDGIFSDVIDVAAAEAIFCVKLLQ